MKFNLGLILIMGAAGALAGLSHDVSSFVDAVNLAKTNGAPWPDYDWRLTALHVAKGFIVGMTGAIGVSQIPGAGGQ